MHPHNIEGPYIKQNKHLTEVEGSEHIPGSSKQIHQKIKKLINSIFTKLNYIFLLPYREQEGGKFGQTFMRCLANLP